MTSNSHVYVQFDLANPFLAFPGSYDTLVALFWWFSVVFPVGINSLRAHSRTRNGNILIKDTDWRYRLANNTLNSVFNGDSKKTVTKTISSKGPKLFSAKGTASLYCCSDNCVIWYNMIIFDFQRHINHYNVNIWLSLSFGTSWSFISESNGGISVIKVRLS
jgi:hypothetical protein